MPPVASASIHDASTARVVDHPRQTTPSCRYQRCHDDISVARRQCRHANDQPSSIDGAVNATVSSHICYRRSKVVGKEIGLELGRETWDFLVKGCLYACMACVVSVGNQDPTSAKNRGPPILLDGYPRARR
ncbi:hypothetical protein ACLOJK_007393 [Asimina triloba]